MIDDCRLLIVEGGSQMYKPADLEDRLIDFAVRIINVVEALPSSKAGNHVAGKLIGSGAAPAPNCGEAESAESRKDFSGEPMTLWSVVLSELLLSSQINNRQSSIEVCVNWPNGAC
jgi:hypothetical protein